MDAKGDSKGEGIEGFRIDAKGLQGDMDRSESKGEDLYYGDDAKCDSYNDDIAAKVDLISVTFNENNKSNKNDLPLVDDPIELKIVFELDKDVICANWIIKFLVDSCDKRIIKILGDTPVEDYLEGENEMYFNCDSIDMR